ncbi:NAD(P)/FAD-dependent oxidoreductase [Pseudoduganella umbonata]|uniref:3-phenylpropionate/trans-cinnamate dioxygenase ferredoxin reductase subunit n=1 Tax=Pseudoduganella umbonata TaxID=864828 RepID=A0A4P8HNE7_9BURK|nr:FAD-dependent oxidoreductase [Pseudoduganella umbonata]MBB3219938.1 3-phenylpropionate/trans-cinnamate dioxygenase ferredoxin reductase subunit [Pseudoduganella umbonata]QCP09952.1 pyridine nucleotide-disulfide oxidoreductase [Pseudoduganella umbonata]
MTLNSIVIAGAGHAGVQVALSLRQDGYTGSISLVNDEPWLPYQRPPLSKAYLLGKIDATAMQFRPAQFYTDQRIDLVADRGAAIDRQNRRLLLASGTVLDYDHLVLATGAHNRPLNVPGAGLANVYGVKTRADAEALAPLLGNAKRVVVIGAGFIGLEFAAVAAAAGAAVDVLELGDRPMARAVSPAMSELFRAAHAAWGVTFHFRGAVAEIEGDNGKAVAVLTADGRRLPADLVVYGIGVIPNVGLALEAGLGIDNGIRVDAGLLTSDPHISALGDVACFPCLQNGERPTRLESVQNAVDQGKLIAARLTGKPAPYTALPWFWTDQGHLKLQIAGLSGGADNHVVLGDPAAQQVSVLCFRGEQLLAVESCGRVGDHMAARKILARPPALTPSMAAAPGFDLKAWEAANR